MPQKIKRERDLITDDEAQNHETSRSFENKSINKNRRFFLFKLKSVEKKLLLDQVKPKKTIGS